MKREGLRTRKDLEGMKRPRKNAKRTERNGKGSDVGTKEFWESPRYGKKVGYSGVYHIIKEDGGRTVGIWFSSVDHEA